MNKRFRPTPLKKQRSGSGPGQKRSLLAPSIAVALLTAVMLTTAPGTAATFLWPPFLLPLVPAPPTAAKDSGQEAAAGWFVYLDPVTGRIVETPAPGQREAILGTQGAVAIESGAGRGRSTEGLKRFDLEPKLGIRGWGVRLDGRFSNYLRVQVAPDGSLVVCETDRDPWVNEASDAQVQSGPTSACAPLASAPPENSAGDAAGPEPVVER